MYEGNRMTSTEDGRGLIMTYFKKIYKFNCDSANDCYFVQDVNELQILRIHHILLKVPASLVNDC